MEHVFVQNQSSMSRSDSGDGQDGPLPLLPLLLLLVQFACSFSEEHHVLFALDLPLEELQRCHVKAHHILPHGKRGGVEEHLPRQTRYHDSALFMTYSDLPHF